MTDMVVAEFPTLLLPWALLTTAEQPILDVSSNEKCFINHQPKYVSATATFLTPLAGLKVYEANLLNLGSV